MKEFLKRNWLTLLSIMLALFLIVKSCQYNNLKQDLAEQTGLVSSLNDTIKIWRDKDSLSHSKIEVIKTSNIKDFINLKFNDKEVQDLQQLVKKYKKQLSNQGSATNFQTITKYDTIYKSNQEFRLDTIGKKLLVSQFTDSINNGWINFKYAYTPNTTSFRLNVKNEYSVIIGEESQGWFKKKKPFVEVINKNPYSETTKLRTYQVQTPAVKKFGIGPFVGYGIGSDFNTGVFIGVGLQYNLIRF